MGDLIELKPKGVVTTKEGEVKQDEAGNPVFTDRIQWYTNGPQIRLLWEACARAVTSHRILGPMKRAVPIEEVAGVMELMEKLAKLHRETNKPYKVELEINYFKGMWHVLVGCKALDLFGFDKKDKDKKKEIKGLALWVAEQLDTYHEIKKREEVEEKLSPNDIVSSKPSTTQVLDFYPRKDNDQ